MGLLQLRPWKPRAVGALGIVASAINCYMCGAAPLTLCTWLCRLAQLLLPPPLQLLLLLLLLVGCPWA